MPAGIDLCLHVVRKDLGAAVANDIARELVAAPHRDGGQAQYVDLPVPNPELTTLTSTRGWALGRLPEALTIGALAEHASVSRRTLLETTTLNIDQIATRCGLGSATSLRARFRDAVGTTPTAYRRTFHYEAA